jgi:hypothetical protein
MSARIIVYVKQGVVESVDVESVEELVTLPPVVVVVDQANREVVHESVTAFVQSSQEIDSTLKELVEAHGYLEVVNNRGDE